MIVSAAALDDAEAILELQKRAYESEARLYNDWMLAPLTQTLPSLREEFATSVVGTLLMRHIESQFPQARGFELFTGSRSQGNLRLYERLGYRRSREKELSAAVTLVFLEKLR